METAGLEVSQLDLDWILANEPERILKGIRLCTSLCNPIAFPCVRFHGTEQDAKAGVNPGASQAGGE